MRLLVTRPEPGAERTAAQLHQRGHEVLVAPLLQWQPVEHASLIDREWAGVLVTSANAIRALAEKDRRALCELPLLAVGERTAERARASGFSNVHAAAGDVRALERLALERFGAETGPLLYLAGEDRRTELGSALDPHGITVHTVTTYRMVSAKRFPVAARNALAASAAEGALHYSARTAEAYLRCAAADRLLHAALAPIHFCLSGEIGARLTEAGAQQVRIAAQPTETALLHLIDSA